MLGFISPALKGTGSAGFYSSVLLRFSLDRLDTTTLSRVSRVLGGYRYFVLQELPLSDYILA